MKKYFVLCFMIFALLLQLSCSKADEGLNCTQQIMPYFANFNFKDANSGEDLFFASSPKYKLKELYAFAVKDVARKDTIRPEVVGTGTERYFKIQLNNTVAKDTLLIKIGVLPDDKFIYTIKKDSKEVCPTYILDKAYFNEVEVIPNQNRLVFKK